MLFQARALEKKKQVLTVFHMRANDVGQQQQAIAVHALSAEIGEDASLTLVGVEVAGIKMRALSCDNQVRCPIHVGTIS